MLQERTFWVTHNSSTNLVGTINIEVTALTMLTEGLTRSHLHYVLLYPFGFLSLAPLYLFSGGLYVENCRVSLDGDISFMSNYAEWSGGTPTV